MAGQNFGGKTADARARTLDRLKMKANSDALSPKEARRLRKLEKRVGKVEVQREKHDNKGWTRLTMQAICGCCTAVLWYKTREAAEKAAAESCLKHHELTDDRGMTETVDGFYGGTIEQF